MVCRLGRTEKENGEELTTVLKEDSADDEARFLLQLYKNPVAQYLVDRLAIVSNFFSIWLWAEHRKRYCHDLNKGELLDAWSSELEGFTNKKFRTFRKAGKLSTRLRTL